MHNSILDHLIVAGATLISSIPDFVRAPLFMIFLVAEWQLLPYVGLGWHGLFSANTILPALVLATGPLLGMIRYTRSSVLESLSQDYIRTARAKGLTEFRVITRHVLKNSMTPVLTVLGLTTANLLAGSIFIEPIFNLRGFGSLAFNAISGGDLDTATGVLLIGAILIMVANLLVDLMYGLLDPRVRIAE
ncbi:ABC transporter permease [Chloroflexi bacterium TSY]|nr:ABC transporter permease [Chloroflexi bacterium TSY]